MAGNWHLVCLTCLGALRLHKLIMFELDGSEVSPHFEGFRNEWDDRWIEGPELLECLQGFLALHLGHVLGTVDENVVFDSTEPWESGEEPLRWATDVDELLGEEARERIPDIDDEFDTPASRELVARLQRMAPG